jgi:hypothetical protein
MESSSGSDLNTFKASNLSQVLIGSLKEFYLELILLFYWFNLFWHYIIDLFGINPYIFNHFPLSFFLEYFYSAANKSLISSFVQY